MWTLHDLSFFTLTFNPLTSCQLTWHNETSMRARRPRGSELLPCMPLNVWTQCSFRGAGAWERIPVECPLHYDYTCGDCCALKIQLIHPNSQNFPGAPNVLCGRLLRPCASGASRSPTKRQRVPVVPTLRDDHCMCSATSWRQHQQQVWICYAHSFINYGALLALNL